MWAAVVLAVVLAAAGSVRGAVALDRVTINTTSVWVPREYTYTAAGNVFEYLWQLPHGTGWADMQVGGSLVVYPNIDKQFSLAKAIEYAASGASPVHIDTIYINNVVSAHCLDEVCAQEGDPAKVSRCREHVGRRYILNITARGCEPYETPPDFRFPMWRRPGSFEEPATAGPTAEPPCIGNCSIDFEYTEYHDPSVPWPPADDPAAGWPVEGIYAGSTTTCNPSFQALCGYYHNYNASAYPSWPIPIYVEDPIEITAPIAIRGMFPEVPAMLMMGSATCFGVAASNVLLQDLIIDASAAREALRAANTGQDPQAVVATNDGIDGLRIEAVEVRGTSQPVVLYEQRAGHDRDVAAHISMTVARWGRRMLQYDDAWEDYENSITWAQSPFEEVSPWDAGYVIGRIKYKDCSTSMNYGYQNVNTLFLVRAPPLLQWGNETIQPFNPPINHAWAFVNESVGATAVVTAVSEVSAIAASRLEGITYDVVEISGLWPPYERGRAILTRDFVGAGSDIPYTDVPSTCITNPTRIRDGYACGAAWDVRLTVSHLYGEQLSEASPVCGALYPKADAIAPVPLSYFGQHGISVTRVEWPADGRSHLWPFDLVRNMTKSLYPLFENCIPRTDDGSFGTPPASEIGRAAHVSTHAAIMTVTGFLVAGIVGGIVWRRCHRKHKKD